MLRVLKELIEEIRSRRAHGSSTIMTMGLIVMGIAMGPIAIDVPTYFGIQQQLQTATDAAALAGASQLPAGQTAAIASANSIAAQNPVGGTTPTFTYAVTNNTFQVKGTSTMNSITAGLFCAFQLNSNQSTGGTASSGNTTGNTTGNTSNTSNSSASAGGGSSAACGQLAVTAGAAAQPSAMDTVLVIDTSSSMTVNSSNGKTLLSNVLSAADLYVSTVLSYNNPAYRIAVVNFDQTATLDVHLTSTSQSPNLSTVTNAINKLTAFNGVGWNTNYQAGLSTALTELETNGNPNSNHQIIFMTDGYANLPADSASYSYSQDQPYTRCTDMVNNSTAVQKLCYTSGRQKICPTMPNPSITNSMIPATATTCGQQYTSAMISAIEAQANRAKTDSIPITTIRIWNTGVTDQAYEVLGQLLLNSTWDPQLLQYMSSTTGGAQYSAQYTDITTINQIYSTLAGNIRVKLSQ